MHPLLRIPISLSAQTRLEGSTPPQPPRTRQQAGWRGGQKEARAWAWGQGWAPPRMWLLSRAAVGELRGTSCRAVQRVRQLPAPATQGCTW